MTEEFSHECVDFSNKFDEIFLKVLNSHAPLKSKTLRANHATYVLIALQKTITKGSYLENVYFKNRDDHSLRRYRKQMNYCSRLYEEERKKFFKNVNTVFVSNNKLFLKTVKPLFSNKDNYGANMKLTEKYEIIQNEYKVAETSNEFFNSLNENSFVINDEHKNLQYSIQKNSGKYKFHPCILIIKNKIRSADTFHFEPVTLPDIENEIKSLNPN